MTKYKVAKLKKAVKDAEEALHIARAGHRRALYEHMAEVLDRDVEVIYSYDFGHWRSAHRHYEQILKGGAK